MEKKLNDMNYSEVLKHIGGNPDEVFSQMVADEILVNLHGKDTPAYNNAYAVSPDEKRSADASPDGKTPA